jgi:hypothetical protein
MIEVKKRKIKRSFVFPLINKNANNKKAIAINGREMTADKGYKNCAMANNAAKITNTLNPLSLYAGFDACSKCHHKGRICEVCSI